MLGLKLIQKEEFLVSESASLPPPLRTEVEGSTSLLVSVLIISGGVEFIHHHQGDWKFQLRPRRNKWTPGGSSFLMSVYNQEKDNNIPFCGENDENKRVWASKQHRWTIFCLTDTRLMRPPLILTEHAHTELRQPDQWGDHHVLHHTDWQTKASSGNA